MSRRAGLLLGGLILALVLAGCAQGLTRLPGVEPAQDQATVDTSGTSERYVVVFKSEEIPGNADPMIAANGGKLLDAFPQVGVAIATSSDPGFADRLAEEPSVHSAGHERFQGLPPLELQEYEETSKAPSAGPTAADDLYEPFQWDIRRVRADQAWKITNGSEETVVAILDTGVAWNHPDLAPNLVYSACFAVDTACDPYPRLHWHGTHVAGTVAAAFGEGRAVGVGPNLGLANYNVFQLHDGRVVAFDSSLWAAMLDAAARGFDVVNMSLGGYIVFPERDAATWTAWNRVADRVRQRGVTIIASAGNANLNLNGPVAHIPSDLTGVVSVGATGIRYEPRFPQDGFYDVRAYYSNTGANVTLVAPGGDLGPKETPFPPHLYLVLSDFVFIEPKCSKGKALCDVGYAWAGGTSMSAPHVAAAAGLIKEQNPNLSPNQVIDILKRAADPLGDRQQFGHGMVNAQAAVEP